MSESSKGAWAHTLGAIVVSIMGFFILVYIVAPVAESLLNLHGRYFVPERFGGGSAVDEPGFLTLIIRGVLVSGFSAAGGLCGAFCLFSHANPKVVAVVFSFLVALWGSLFVIAGFMMDDMVMSLVMLSTGMVPPFVVAYWVWQGDF